MAALSSYGFFFFSSRRRHTRWTGDWSSDVCFFRSRLPPGTRPDRREGCELPHLFSQAGMVGRRGRSEERRVGKECRSRGAACDEKKNGGGASEGVKGGGLRVGVVW